MNGIVIGLLVASLFMGCNNGSRGSSGVSDVHTFDFDPEELRKEMNESYLLCDSQDCPEFVGGLYGIYQGHAHPILGSCSASLIDHNKILTNAHCVPDSVQSAGANCQGTMKINFPATGKFKYERYDCAKIVSISAYRTRDKVARQADWAVIEFAGHSPRTPVKVSAEGVPQNSEVKLYKINFGQSNGTGVGNVVPTTCLANANHFESLQNLGPISPLVNVSECSVKLIKGNSGTGILNASGEIVGIFSFVRYVEDSEEEWAMELNAKFPGVKQNYGGGTNVACIKEFQDQPISPMCYFAGFLQHKVISALYQKIFQTQMSAAFIRQEIESHRDELIYDSTPYLLYESTTPLDEGPSLKVFIKGESAGRNRLIYQTAMNTFYPYLPLCVQPGQPEVFEAQVLQLEIPPLFFDNKGEPMMRSEIDADFRATQNLQGRLRGVLLKKVDGNEYEMTPKEGDFLGKDFVKILGLEKNSIIYIPICGGSV